MYIYESHKLIFIAHPRTASRATRDALATLSVCRVEGHHPISDYEIKTMLAAGGRVVCTKRNMFDILVSWYFNLCHTKHCDPPPTFTNWLKQIVNNTDIRYIDRSIYPLYHFGLPYATQVLRYEHLEADLKELTDSLSIPLSLKKVGVTQRDRDYRTYYTPEAREIVEHHWGEDLCLTGYTF